MNPLVLETLVRGDAHAQTFQALQQLIHRLQHHRRLDPDGRLSNGECATRLVTSLMQWLERPGLELSPDVYMWLCLWKRELAALVAVSGYRSLRHWHLLLGHRDERGLHLDARALRHYFALTSYRDWPSELFARLADLPADLAVPAMLGALSEEFCPGDEERRRREQLQNGLLQRLQELPPNDVILSVLVRVYFLLSYGEHADKHRTKAAINAWLARWLASRLGAMSGTVAPPRRTRPLLLVVMEVFGSNHAMFRCYADTLRQLRQDYRLVALAPEGSADQGTAALVDELRTYASDADGVLQAVRDARLLAPDLVYFPSVGMSLLGIVLSVCRLAPIQFMGLGHPATTGSEAMDYVILGADMIGERNCFREKVLVRAVGGNRYDPHGQYSGPCCHWPGPGRTAVHIAIPSIAFKLSAGFFSALRQIRARAGRPLVFHFFPFRKGLSLDAWMSWLLELFPDAVVHPGYDYPVFLEKLRACDLALSSFPFGNTNGTVDCLLNGLPVVALLGDEPHARTDFRLLHSLGLQDELCARDVEAYIDIALTLIGDDERRLGLGRRIAETGPEQVFYGKGASAGEGEFVELVAWLRNHHEDIRESSQNVWRPEHRACARPVDATFSGTAGPVLAG